MRSLMTTLWIGKLIVGLFFSGEVLAPDLGAVLMEPETTVTQAAPPLDITLRAP
jgi:hypothetical protein